MSKVLMYSTGFCPYCFLAKRLLGKRGVEFEERRLTRRSVDRDQLSALGAAGRTYPQIFIGGQPMGGFAELRLLERDGALARLLSDAP
jgi:glutaredoxin 3